MMKKILLTIMFAMLMANTTFAQCYGNYPYLKGQEVELKMHGNYINDWGENNPFFYSQFYNLGLAMPRPPFNTPNVPRWGTFVSGEVDLDAKKITFTDIYGDQTVVSEGIDSIIFYNRYSDARLMTDYCYVGLYLDTVDPMDSPFMRSLLASDECLGGGGAYDHNSKAIDHLMCTPYDSYSSWNAMYTAIEGCNFAIANLDNCTIGYSSQAELDDMKGQAYFLRAYYYYQLASKYGNIPVYTDNDATMLKYSQSTPKAIWGQILLDLKTAISLMLPEKKDPSHIKKNDFYGEDIIYPANVDKYAAEAIIGRAWLFYTGFYGNGENLADIVSTKYSPLTSVQLPDGTTLTKQNIISYIDDVVKNSGAKLVPDFRNLWAYTNRLTVEDYDYTKGQNLEWVENDNGVNPESLFEIQYNTNASWSGAIGIGMSNLFGLYLGARSIYGAESFPFGSGWGYGCVCSSFYNDWVKAEPNDMRRDASVNVWSKNQGLGSVSDIPEATDYYNKKLAPIQCKTDKPDTGLSHHNGNYDRFEFEMYAKDFEDAPNGMNFQTGHIHDLVLVRFADVLLMQSELKEDVSGINKVRQRAGLSPISSYSLAALQNERKWELAFEGTRWNDIRRWHIAAEALGRQEGQDVLHGVAGQTTSMTHGGGYAERYNATAGFEKIPYDIIKMSGFEMKQNPGWIGEQSTYVAYNEGDEVLYESTTQAEYDRYCFVQDSLQHVADSIKHVQDSIKNVETRAKFMANLAGTGSKKWTWNDDGNGCWGNAGHTGVGSNFTADDVDGKWWGVYTPEDLVEQLHHSDTDTPTGEESSSAYMIFDVEGNVNVYGANNNVIRSGQFSLPYCDLDRGSGWSIGTLHTDQSAILFPFSINEGGVKVTDFDIMYLDQNNMTLVYTKGIAAGSWGEITWWRFKAVN